MQFFSIAGAKVEFKFYFCKFFAIFFRPYMKIRDAVSTSRIPEIINRRLRLLYKRYLYHLGLYQTVTDDDRNLGADLRIGCVYVAHADADLQAG